MINHIGTMPLETERLILRKAGKADYDNIFDNLLSDKEASDKAGWKYFNNKEEMIESFETVDIAKNIYSWTIFLKNSNTPVGSIGVHSQEDDMLSCAIGYSIHNKYCNNGYATESLKVVLHFLLNQVGYNRIFAKYRGNNIASKKVLEKCKMVYEGTERQSYYKNGQFMDRHIYSILKEDLK